MNPKTKPKINSKSELKAETLNGISPSSLLIAGEAVKCPECGKEMEKGYIITNAIRWSKKKHTQVAFGQEVIVPWHLTALTNVEASRCPKCRLVLFHYEIPRAEITPESFLKKCAKCGEAIPVASDYCPKCGTKQKEKKGSP